MATYPGRGNPVMDALRGKISVRQLRVMVEHLPPNNAAARLLNGRWGDLERLIHDCSSQLRLFNTNYYNVNREKGKRAIEADLLPTPEELETKPDSRSPEQIQQGRQALQSVLNRPNPK